jgi:hypothetical protein
LIVNKDLSSFAAIDNYLLLLIWFGILAFLLIVNLASLSCGKPPAIDSRPSLVIYFMQHFLYFLPLPQGQGSFRPTLSTFVGKEGFASL